MLHPNELLLSLVPLAHNTHDSWWRTLLVFALLISGVTILLATIVGTTVGLVILVKTLGKR